MIRGTVRLNWKNDPPTEKQLKAINNMRTALKWNTKTPETKGECSALIGEMKKEISNRLMITGQISPHPAYEAGNDFDDEGNLLENYLDNGDLF